jgi:hypothetical protein
MNKCQSWKQCIFAEFRGDTISPRIKMKVMYHAKVTRRTAKLLFYFESTTSLQGKMRLAWKISRFGSLMLHTKLVFFTFFLVKWRNEKRCYLCITPQTFCHKKSTDIKLKMLINCYLGVNCLANDLNSTHLPWLLRLLTCTSVWKLGADVACWSVSWKICKQSMRWHTKAYTNNQ